MAKTVFDVQVRTIECKNCGAPVATAIQGGQVSCEYCGAVNVVTTRRAAERAGVERSMSDEVARLSRLKAQLENPLSGHVYDLDRPPIGWAPGEINTSEGMNRAVNEWRQARSSPTPAVPEEQRKLCWLALHLADGYRASRQPIKARAVLETVLEMLQDSGLRHVVRCRLASEAVAEGDYPSAEGWLRECDPYPEVLELDSAYREAKALLYARKGQASELLGVVGMREGDVPIAPEHKRRITLMRIHGLELAGHHAEADGELASAIAVFGQEAVIPSLNRRGFAPQAVQRSQNSALQQQLEGFVAQRQKMARGLLSAIGPNLGMVPIFALILMIPVSIVRCSADADPLMGVYGYPLCPEVCEGCRGPVRVVTRWSQTGPGEYSSDGAQYFCSSDTNRIDQMSGDQLESMVYQLEYWEMSWLAAFGATFLILFVLLLPLVPLGTIRLWWVHREKIKEVELDIENVARQLHIEPPPRPPQKLGGLVRAFLFCFITAGVAGLLVMIGMAL